MTTTLSAYTALASVSAASAADASKGLRHAARLDRQALQKQAVDFEAMYLTQMLQPMFADLQAEEPFGGGAGEEVWKSLQLQEYGRAVAAGGGIGIASVVAGELLKAQEGRAAAAGGVGDSGPAAANAEIQ